MKDPNIDNVCKRMRKLHRVFTPLEVDLHLKAKVGGKIC